VEAAGDGAAVKFLGGSSKLTPVPDGVSWIVTLVIEGGRSVTEAGMEPTAWLAMGAICEASRRLLDDASDETKPDICRECGEHRRACECLANRVISNGRQR
jgi:hypothetical protein